MALLVRGLLKIFTVLLVLLTMPQAYVYAVNAVDVETQIKAAFLGRFLGFIEREGKSEAIVQEDMKPLICVYGDKQILHALQALEQVSRADLRNTSYKQVEGVGDLASCTMLYVGKLQYENLEQTGEALPQSKIITVSDSPGFAAKGGMIELVKDSGRIKFILNRGAARISGIKFSAQLLSLAKDVIE